MTQRPSPFLQSILTGSSGLKTSTLSLFGISTHGASRDCHQNSFLMSENSLFQLTSFQWNFLSSSSVIVHGMASSHLPDRQLQIQQNSVHRRKKSLPCHRESSSSLMMLSTLIEYPHKVKI